MADLPIVLVFAPWPVRLQSPPVSELETREFDCRWHASDERLNEIVVRERPDAIASFGDRASFPRLASSPYDVRRRWLHFDVGTSLSEADRERAGTLVYCNILHRVLTAPHAPPSSTPLVSVFTPTFRSGERVRRAFRSLQAQTYNRWEWVIADDSDDEGATWRTLCELADTDARVSIHASGRHSGRIGEMKRRACALSQGDILVELDHDDELTPDALAVIADVFRHNPQVGFIYSDCAEVEEGTGAPLTYPDGWAFGYGRYRTERFRGQDLQVACAPPVNGTTIRHIVSAPNHVRAWRRDEYWRIGGHNPHLHVADDYELIVRTFLQTEMRHVPSLLYLQYLGGGINAQDRRRREIQRLVRAITHHYEERITERLSELDLQDRGRQDSLPAPASARPLVSVVIPTYDRPDLCARAVTSALSQDWAALEVIVVGDACPRFDAVRQAVGDRPRVRCLNLSVNHGAGGAAPRNFGVLAAAGAWIAYLDDDNVWDADHISSLMTAMQTTKASWGFSSMQVDGTDLEFTAPVKGRIDTSCLMHAARLFHEIGPWRSSQELNDYANDWEFVSRLLATGETWMATRRPTVHYNLNTSRQSGYIQRLVATVTGRPWPTGAESGPLDPRPPTDS